MAVDPQARARPLDHGGGAGEALAAAADLGALVRPSRPASPRAVDRGPGEGAGAVDLVGGGGDDVGDDGGQGVEMGLGHRTGLLRVRGPGACGDGGRHDPEPARLSPRGAEGRGEAGCVAAMVARPGDGGRSLSDGARRIPPFSPAPYRRRSGLPLGQRG